MIRMRLLNFILCIDGVYINLRMNEINNMMYEWTNEAYFVFSKEGPRVEVPYVGPSFEMFYDTSTIQMYCVDEMYYI